MGIIANFELKIKQLIIANNENDKSGDMSSAALRAYCENAERIDRLKFAVTQLQKRKNKQEVTDENQN